MACIPHARSEDPGRHDEAVRSWPIGPCVVHVEHDPFRISIALDDRPVVAQRARRTASSLEYRTAAGWSRLGRLRAARLEPLGDPGSAAKELVLRVEGREQVTAVLRIRPLARAAALELRWEIEGAGILALRDDFVTGPEESFHGVGERPLRLPGDGAAEADARSPPGGWILSSRSYALRARAAREDALEAFFPDPDSLRLEVKGSTMEIVLLPGKPRDVLRRIRTDLATARRRPHGSAGVSARTGWGLCLQTLPDGVERERIRRTFQAGGLVPPAFWIERGSPVAYVEAVGAPGGLVARDVPAFPPLLPGDWRALKSGVRRSLDGALSGRAAWIPVTGRVLEMAAPDGELARVARRDSDFALRLLAVAATQPLLCLDWPAAPRLVAGGPAANPAMRRFFLLHAAFARLGAALSADEVEGQLPLLRHVFVEHPADPQAWRSADQWLYGPDVMVAPVLSASSVRRLVYLPSGEWLELGRGSEERVLKGPKSALVEVPLGAIGLFERRGARWSLRRYLPEGDR